MAYLDIEPDKRKAYAEWIGAVRTKCGCGQEAFAQKVCRFVWNNADREEMCGHFSRNSVGNWEKGKNLPVNIETFVSIALIEYSGDTERRQLSCEERKNRLNHVRAKMDEYLGRKFYCRNLNETLLIAAARGIYSLEELPEVRRKMGRILHSVVLTSEEKQTYAIGTATTAIEAALNKAESHEDMERLVGEYSAEFLLGARTVGERMKERFESIANSQIAFPGGVSLEKAVSIFAPRFRGTYTRVFSPDICVSRRWLIELCVRLRVTRADMNKTLENAGMMPLSDSQDDLEFYLKEEPGCPIGSVRWYLERRKTKDEHYVIRFPRARALPIEFKLELCAFMSCYLKTLEDEDLLPPVDYILDYFLTVKEGTALLQKMREELPGRFDEPGDTPQEHLFELYYSEFEDIVDRTHMELVNGRGGTEEEIKQYHCYRNEYKNYYTVTAEKYNGQEGLSLINRLRFFSSLSYSLFTGKLYSGQIYQDDLNELQDMLGNLDAVNRFLNQLWVVMLERKQIRFGRVSDKCGVYQYRGDPPRRTRIFNMDTLTEDCCESWMIALEDAQNDIPVFFT